VNTNDLVNLTDLPPTIFWHYTSDVCFPSS